MRALLLIAVVALSSCASRLEQVSLEARSLPATRSVYGNCQDHARAVLLAAETEGVVLRVCSSWMRSCHVAAVVDGYVYDNGALGFGTSPVRLEKILAHYTRTQLLHKDDFLARWEKP